MKFVVGLAAVALGLGLAGAASAADLIITDVGVGNGSLGNVFVAGYGAPWTTPILMTDSNHVLHIVFCDDLQHDVYVTGGQHLLYDYAPVTVDGFGNALSEATSNRMGQIADLGRAAYLGGDEAGAIAAQAAIWGIEYGIAVSSTDGAIQADILSDLLIQDNGRGRALGIVSESGTQNQIIGLVPEPATWAMMMVGVFGLGAMLRRRRDQSQAATA
jgi:hypothetical protein